MTDPATTEIDAVEAHLPAQDDAEAADHAGTTAGHRPGLVRRARGRRGLVALALVPAVAVGMGGAAWAQQAHKTISVDVDGQTRTVSTWSSSVSGALSGAGISVTEHDDVSPAASSSISDGTAIVVRSAREVPATVDGEDTTVWTTAATTADTLAQVSEDSGADDVSVAVVRSARSTGSATDVPLTSAGKVTVVADGSTKDVTVDAPVYADDVLDMAGTDATGIDRVYAATTTDGDVRLEVTRVQRGTVTEEQPIAHETQRVEDDTLAEGATEVVQAGSDGVRTVARYVESVGGEETVSIVRSDEVTTEPVTEIVHVGTKTAKDEEAAPTEASAEAGSSSSSGSTASGGSGSASSASAEDASVWAAIAQCESGGNPTTNTGNGYYGMYQFALGTWQAYGGTGLPSDASAAEQLRIAKLVQAGQGWGAWGSCSARAGVS